MKNLKSKFAVVAASAAPVAAFAQETGYTEQITTAITTNVASATAIVVSAGLALIGLAFVSMVLRKGRRAANGRV